MEKNYKKLIRNGSVCAVVDLSTNASIPLDTKNQDYREFLEWEAAGNTAVEEEV